MTNRLHNGFNARLALSTLSVLLLTSAGTGCDGMANDEDSFGSISSNLNMSRFQGWRPVPTSGAPGGLFSSGPAATTRSASSIDLFARGSDNALWSNFAFTVNNGASWNWNGWSSLGGVLLGKASATTWGGAGDRIAVAVRGTTNQAYVRTWLPPPNGGWSPWAQVSNGTLAHDPAITYASPNLFVVVLGTDNRFYFSKNDVSAGFNPANWTWWAPIPGGVLISEPGAATTFGKLIVSGLGTDNKYHMNTSTDAGASWSGWAPIPSSFAFSSGPALVAARFSGQLNIFGTAAGSGQMLNATTFDDGASWSSFQSAGGVLLNGPAGASPAAGTIQTFGRGTDNNIHWNPYKE